MIHLSFLGILVSIFILAAPSPISAGVEKDTIADPPKELTDVQKMEWQIGQFSGWLRLCGYGSKSSQISSFMKKSPYFRKGEAQWSKYDMSMSCSSSDENLNRLLGSKDEWEQYLDITYTSKKIYLTAPFDGLWVGTGQRDSGRCRVPASTRGRLESVRIELMIREQEVTGRVISALIYTQNIDRISVNAPIRGTVSENGEFDLQVGQTDLGAELVLRGRLPKEGDRAIGKWDTPNCHGTLTLNRDFRVY